MSIASREHQERIVFGRSGILALAAIATISAAALVISTSSADARGSGDGVTRGSIHFGGFRSGFRRAGLRFHHRRHWHRSWHARWYRPWIYGVGTTATPAHGVRPKPQQSKAQPGEQTPTN
jgi:hypothetical protein